ncbi:translation initiation factor IF-3 [Fangia hongkongensis]|uniref:translation initiation factor IF-3 n=1 Tax=Fangia hongkongensis TaxID=270495 RepID=UPI0012B56887|nr:translation initiation factor IF-3 [Fangia hongkongensis]MBK2124390.1 translation initiation factor IF-3 [Fangia hongkongensis]
MSKSDQKAPINDQIKAREVRLIGLDGEQIGVISTREALEKAENAGVDLVEMVSQASPPVCRLMDYGKYLFEQGKKKAAAKKKQKQMQVKEIKLRPGTDIGDYQVKLRNLIKFLENGDKVKITVRFRGREMAHQELGMEMLKRLEADLEDYGVVEHRPKMEGRQMIMVLGPKKK